MAHRVCARVTFLLPIRFFCAIFFNLEPVFGHFSPKKEPGFWPFLAKKSSVLNPLNIHIDTISME